MSIVRTRIDKAGRLLIPAKLRTELNVRPGDSVILEAKGNELRVRPYRQALRDVQAIIRQYIPDRDRSLVDELIAERRQEAERE
jgi:AbrB family transcriptional regulator (stage V sporulation protein T)